MRRGEIDFPEQLLRAIEDNKLAVFAGAGVSMGNPANLPSFHCLAEQIAKDTGKVLNGDQEDRFLGKLKDKGTDVHELVASILTHNQPKPTQLHKNLLRLYDEVEKIRIVTTNFDDLFEQASDKVFPSEPPVVFRAPALPLGQKFNGIVHLHGAVSRPDEMILTDRDFGRGYLTEGWALRFLIDLFDQFTVLFVGYSHKDTIINYLARALTREKEIERFALTTASEKKHWQQLDIKVIEYQNHGTHHAALDKGVEDLANLFRCGVLDWRRIVNNYAKQPPYSLNEEATDIIEYVLKDMTKTRFFTEKARSPEWIVWLDKKKYLDGLFDVGTHIERNSVLTELAAWLAKHFMYRNADNLLSLIARHGTRLHPDFWQDLVLTLGRAEPDPLDKDVLSRWVSLLLDTAPKKPFWVCFLEMGKRCIEYDMRENVLMIFDAMSESPPYLNLGVSEDKGNTDTAIEVKLQLTGEYCQLNELWEKGLKPHMEKAAEPVLEIVVKRLKERHSILSSWKKPSCKWDVASWQCIAIEPKKDINYDAINVLIDAGRDCLEWLANHKEDKAAAWCARLFDSEVPLLRRLAVHALSSRVDLTADEKLDWILVNIGMCDIFVRNELFQAVQAIYPDADTKHRKKFIKSVLAYCWPDEKDDDKELHSAHYHFCWLDLLHHMAPDCALIKHALDSIRARYSEYELSKYSDPELYLEVSSYNPQSPWSVDELLAKPAADWLPELLSFSNPDPFSEVTRNALVAEVAKAAQQCFDWGLDLAHELAGTKEWNADLWSGLVRAWEKMELDESQQRKVFQQLRCTELHSEHGRVIADALHAFVKNEGKPYAFELLPQANKIALTLWREIDRTERVEKSDDWYSLAINHPARILTEFWVSGLQLCKKQRHATAGIHDDTFLHALLAVVQDSTLAGRLGRSIIASYLLSLLDADEEWTKKNLLPLFETKIVADFQAVWDGFLARGEFTPAVADAVAELLKNQFLRAVEKIESDLSGRQHGFIKYYTRMIGYFVSDPIEEWILELFKYGKPEARNYFASEIKSCLKALGATQQKEWWSRWLKRYWKNRLPGVPAALESEEIKQMLEWLPHLDAVFPEAVELAIQKSLKPSPHCRVVFELRNSTLLKDQPEEVAKLLIHFGKPEYTDLIRVQGREVVDELLKADIPPELKTGLQELIAQLDLK